MAVGYQRPRARPDRNAVPVVGHQLLGADDQRRGGADGAGLPQPHRHADRRDPVRERRRSRRDRRRLDLRPWPAQHRPRVPAASARRRLADSKTPVSTVDNGDLPARGGRRRSRHSRWARSSSTATAAPIVLNLARTLRARRRPTARWRARCSNDISVGSASAGPVSIAMTVRERRDLPDGFAVERLGIGPEDARKSRLIAGSAVARLDNKTAVAFGFAEGAKAMERRLARASQSGAFLIARDIAGDPGFTAKRNGSIALRHEFGGTGVTLSGETGNVWQDDQDQRDRLALSLDQRRGRPQLRPQLAVARHEPARGKAVAARRPHERCAWRRRIDIAVPRRSRRGTISATAGAPALTARRGWTDFAGGQVPDRRLWLRPRQARPARRQRPARLPDRAAAAGRAWRLRDDAADGL